MIKATELEAKVIRSIATNSYNECNYGSPKSYAEAANPVWRNSINDAGMPSGVEGKMLSGVCSSLAKKGFAGFSEEGRDSTAWISEAGYNAMIEFFGSHEQAFKDNLY
jgi:hypothetical protein